MKKPYEKRIKKEIKVIEENPMHNESIKLEEENNFSKLIVTLPGPEEQSMKIKTMKFLLKFLMIIHSKNQKLILKHQ